MENIIQAKRERKMTKFKTIINYQIIYRYFILINPLPCVISFVIAAIFFGLLENQNILWNIILVILLYTIWMILKKKLCRFPIERMLDIYNAAESHGYISFSDAELIYLYENEGSETYNYELFRRLYNLKNVYLMKTTDHRTILVDKESMTPEERKYLFQIVREKMPQIKFIGREEE